MLTEIEIYVSHAGAGDLLVLTSTTKTAADKPDKAAEISVADIVVVVRIL